MMRSVVLGLMLWASAAQAAPVVVKLGTLAPDGSPWHTHLKEVGEKWKELSDGQVTVKVFAGGSVGNEADMVKKLRVNSLQASLLTGTGIRDIDPSIQTLLIPMVLTSNEELDYVIAKMTPKFEKILADKGFVSLYWGDAGWVRFFTQKPARTVADMKGVKVFAWAGDENAVEAWKLAGFNPVVVSATDITTSLTTGLLEAVDTTPLVALSFQWYRKAAKMTDIRWAPLVGSLIISKKSWDQVPADLRPKLAAAAKEICDRMNAKGRILEDEAIATMKKDGMEVVTLTEAERQTWQKAAEKAHPWVREKVVPAAVWDEVVKYRDEFRAQKK